MSKIYIADKATLDAIKLLIGTASPSSGDLTTLFNGLKFIKDVLGATGDAASAAGTVEARLAELLTNRLTSARAGYLDYLSSLNTRLTDTRAGRLDLVGTAGDAAGASTLFARLAQIVGYVDTLETVLSNMKTTVVASNTVRLSADTEESDDTNAAWNWVKEVMIFHCGTIRVKWDMKTSNASYAAQAYVYMTGPGGDINDDYDYRSALQSTTSTEYVTFSIDIPVNDGCTVTLNPGCINNGSAYWYVRNFRIYFDPGSIDGYFTNS